MQKLSWRQAVSWHLQRQRLDARLPRTRLLQLISELCGLHAQVMSSAELTAWCRIDGLRAGDISQALWQDRKLLKTWAMRRTLHLMPAAEYGMWLKAFEIYPLQKAPAFLAYYGVTQQEMLRITEAVREALGAQEPPDAALNRGGTVPSSRDSAAKAGAFSLGDRLLTRLELAIEIARLTQRPDMRDKLRQGWGSLLKPACYRGYLCFGPNKGQQTQFAAPPAAALPAIAGGDSSALPTVARRYLATYGPATEREFARWFHAGARTARQLMESLGDELEPVDIEGTRAWMLRKHVKPALQSDPVRTVRLLPAFDQYVFAAGLHSANVMPGDFHSRIYRPQGWLSPVLLVDGRMDGVWRFSRNAHKLSVVIEPFVDLKPRVKRAAAEEAERLAAFMERSLDLQWHGRFGKS